MKSVISISRRVAVFLLLFVVLVGFSACMTQNIVVAVNPDGSGQIAVTRVFPAHVVTMMDAQLKQMREQMSGYGEEAMAFLPDNPYFDEEKLEKSARLYGPGVKLVSARPVERAGAKGAAALYDFENINDLKLNPNAMMAMMSMMDMDNEDMMEMMEDQLGGGTIQFAFEKGADRKTLRVMLPAEMTSPPFVSPSAEASVLAVETEGDSFVTVETEEIDEGVWDADVPPHLAVGAPGMAGMPPGFTGQETAADAMRMYFRGVRMSMSVEVRGTVERTTASHPTPGRASRFVLYDIDFDAIMDTPAFQGMIDEDAMMGMDSPDAFMSGLYALPGVVAETNRELVIEFK